jgi:uncharacterized RDD family membrane protein YckC
LASGDQHPPTSDQPPPPTLSQLAIGSALLAADVVGDRLDNLEAEPLPPERPPEEVLIPRSEWGRAFGESGGTSARYLTLGVMSNARSRAGRSAGFLWRASDRAGRALDGLLRPFTHSRLLRPFRNSFDTLEDRGRSQVDNWIDVGRSEDVRNRTVAQSAINQVAGESMDEIIANPRIQLFIQEIVEAQSLGIVDEGIEEMRERTVTADMVLERPVRSLFRRAPRSDIPPPDLEAAHLRRPQGITPQALEKTLFGYYAGIGSRFLALAVDLVLIAVLIAISIWFVTTALSLLGVQRFYQDLIDSMGFDVVSVAISSFLGSAIVFCYAVILWSLNGRTLGMALMGLKVVAPDGSHISVWRALVRVIMFFISAILFFLGFLWVLGDDRRQGWHDKVAGTFVIYAWPAKPEETFLREHIQ